VPVPAAQFVASGTPYKVTDVQGRPPADLDDFVGHIEFIAVRDSQRCGIAGFGTRNGAVVRFHEKQGGTGRDMRVWQVCSTRDKVFEASAMSNF